MADVEDKNPFDNSEDEIDKLLQQLPEPTREIQKKLMELMVKK